MSAVKLLLTLLFLTILLIFSVIWLIYWKLWGKEKQKQEERQKELKQKWSKHLLNFAPSRLKNRTWQKSLGKYKKKAAKSPKKVTIK